MQNKDIFNIKRGIIAQIKWNIVRKKHIAHQPDCQTCGRKTAVQVHHIFPLQYCMTLGREDLELDDRNLITLCETNEDTKTSNHHLLIGHLGNFRNANLNVIADTREFYGKSANKLLKDDEWKRKKANRLKSLDKMNESEKDAIRRKMDERFPKKSGLRRMLEWL